MKPSPTDLSYYLGLIPAAAHPHAQFIDNLYGDAERFLRAEDLQKLREHIEQHNDGWHPHQA